MVQSSRMIHLQRRGGGHSEERLESMLGRAEDENADGSAVEWECCATELMALFAEETVPAETSAAAVRPR